MGHSHGVSANLNEPEGVLACLQDLQVYAVTISSEFGDELCIHVIDLEGR